MNHLGTLLCLKFTMIRNAFHGIRRRSRLEFFTLIFFALGTLAGLFVFFLFSFRFFRSQEPFGPILIDEAFYLFTFALFIMLFISSAVSAYASLFRSGEVCFLLTRPPGWSDIYFLKLTEAVWYSSWALLLVAVPFMTAYGITKQAPVFFPLLCVLFYIPFIVLAGTVGTLTTTCLIHLFPDRKKRRFIFLAFLAALVYLFFLKSSPA